VINAFVPLAEAWLEHAGQKDESFASKYLQPVMATAKALSGKAVGASAGGVKGMNTVFAARA
jgi:hypothetical protein